MKSGERRRPFAGDPWEPLVEKPNSYKALARAEAAYKGDSAAPCSGTVLLYFQKDSTLPDLGYGYRRYSLFEGITHQMYLPANDYTLQPHRQTAAWKEALFASRRAVIPGKGKGNRSAYWL